MADIFSELPFHNDSDDEQEQVVHQATDTLSSDRSVPQLEPVPVPEPSVHRPNHQLQQLGIITQQVCNIYWAQAWTPCWKVAQRT